MKQQLAQDQLEEGSARLQTQVCLNPAHDLWNPVTGHQYQVLKAWGHLARPERDRVNTEGDAESL